MQSMFDKVKFWVPRTHGITEFQHLRKIVQKADADATFVGKANGGELSVMLDGRIRNMRVREYLGGVSIYGSLNKFIHTTNLAEMSLNDTRRAISELSYLLGIDLMKEKVSEIEFGTNITVKNSVGSYFKVLGEMPRRLRNAINRETVYYQRRGEDRDTLVFYDKLKQMRKEKLPIPAQFENANVLRLELRLKRNLARLMHIYEVKGENLCSVDFYNMLLNTLKEKYFMIEKIQSFTLDNVEDIKRPSDAVKFFFSALFAESCKGQEAIEYFLQTLKDAKIFKERADYVKCRKQITNVINSAKMAEKDPLLMELDEAVNKLQPVAERAIPI